MSSLSEVNPFVRVGHYYRFPIERNQAEVGRIRYCYAFHFVAGGRGTVSVGGKTYPVKKGDLIYFPPEEPHSFYANPDNPLSTYNLYCDLWNFKLVSTQHLVWDPSDFNRHWLTRIEPCSELSSLPVVTPIQHDASLCQLFIHAVSHVGKQEQYSELIVSRLSQSILVSTCPNRIDITVH